MNHQHNDSRIVTRDLMPFISALVPLALLGGLALVVILFAQGCAVRSGASESVNAGNVSNTKPKRSHKRKAPVPQGIVQTIARCTTDTDCEEKFGR